MLRCEGRIQLESIALLQGSAYIFIYFCKGPDGKYLGFMGHMIFISTILCHGSTKAQKQYWANGHDYVPTKLLTKIGGRVGVWPWGLCLLTSTPQDKLDYLGAVDLPRSCPVHTLNLSLLLAPRPHNPGKRCLLAELAVPHLRTPSNGFRFSHLDVRACWKIRLHSPRW